MRTQLTRAFYHAQIRVLLALKPVALFQKLNQLDWYRDTLRHWIAAHQFSRNDKILEVGCATGALAEYLAECGYLTTAVDASQPMIKAAMANKQHRAQYQLASVMNLPFQNDIFDGVISASLINIVADQNKAIAEMLRVCKSGGLITFLVPTLGFDEAQLHGLVDSTGISGFAAAGLRAWHRLAPKMRTEQAKSLLQQAELEPFAIRYHLQGMVFSVAARKR